MYNTATGRVIMTVALGLVAAGFAIGERIMRVRI
jgi:Flp pilus assembly protein TadB